MGKNVGRVPAIGEPGSRMEAAFVLNCQEVPGASVCMCVFLPLGEEQMYVLLEVMATNEDSLRQMAGK